MKKRILLLFLVGLSTLGLLFAAGRREEAPPTPSGTGEISGELTLVHYLTEDAKLQALDDLVAGFNAEYPDVKVNVESTSMDNYQDVVKLKISTGDAPDIIFGSPKTYSDLVKSGNIKDISDEPFTSRVPQGVLPNMKVDGKVYGIPLDEMANVVFYNKDIFSRLGLTVPKTYSQFIEVCKALEDAGYDACAAGYQDNISIGANFYTIYYGSHYLDYETYAAEMMDGTLSAHDLEPMQDALRQWREIMQYQNDDRKTITTDRAEQLFANGETGMIIIGTWGLGAIINFNPDGNYGGFMFPSEEVPEENAVPLATDDTWMISQNAHNEATALAFFEYMTRKDVNAKWCATTSQLSAIDGVVVETLPQAAKDIAEILTTARIANWISLTTFSGQYDTAYYKVLQDFAITDSMTIAEFCDNLDSEFAAARK